MKRNPAGGGSCRRVATVSACLALAMVAWPAQTQPTGLVVIVAKESKAPPKLGPDELSAIFLGASKTFSNGERAVPLDQKSGTEPYGAFYQKVAGRTEAQMKAHWSRIMFTGKGQPPQEAGDGAAVKKLVAANPNMLGYVEASLVDAGVRVVAEVK